MQDKLEELTEKLRTYEGPDKVISSVELNSILSKRPAVYTKSLISSLDNLIYGFEAGELTTLSGPTGNGKTLLAKSLTYNFAIQDEGSVWFTYEVIPRNFLRDYGQELPLFYMPTQLVGNEMQWIYNRILEAKVKYGVQNVFLDHLHYLVDMGKNVSVDIGKTMRSLKKMAVGLELKIFLIAHMMKTRADAGEPSLGDCRDSSFVEQESDNVFFVWRSKKDESASTLKVAKNRGKGVFGAKVKLHKVGARLVELANEHEE